jgi:hypothetical protein
MLWKLNIITNWVLSLIAEFEQKIENKNDLWKRALNEREQHFSLKVLTSETAHTGRERENTPAKLYQGKAWATIAQQDCPINMAINSQLLVCKA